MKYSVILLEKWMGIIIVSCKNPLGDFPFGKQCRLDLIYELRGQLLSEMRILSAQ